MRIEDIDKNFRPAKVGEREVAYLNAIESPFSLEGFPWGDPAKGEFFRLPPDMKVDDNLANYEDVNGGAYWNAHHQTSGGAVRFRTDSAFISVRSNLSDSCDMNHMPRAGSAGFDLYCGCGKDAVFAATAQPNRDEAVLERVLFDGPQYGREMRDWILNFPLYGGLKTIEIGLEPGSSVEPPTPHVHGRIAFYGSSITQGGCASRPGNNYCSMLCRALDAEQVNIGFSGCGRGEFSVARAIASIDGLDAFVMDYDHNAPNPDHLLATHERFFRIVREARPDLPVVMLSRCDVDCRRFYDEAEAKRRRDVVKATYDHAVADGDRHVHFIDGFTLFGDDGRDACTVDGTHPNDLGFRKMYETVLPVLRRAIGD